MNADGLERFLIKRGFPILGIDIEGDKYHVYLSDCLDAAESLVRNLPDAHVVFELVELPPPTFLDKARVICHSVFHRIS